MKSIALIIPYFGRFPNYFNFFLKSCEYNQTIHFLIFTDDETDYEYPKNVFVKHQSFEDFKARVENALDNKFTLFNPYKICDYRPAFGYIFQDELKEYDCWGHCDTDLIFGNIRDYATDEILDQYEKVFANGHLTIYQNNDRMKHFFHKEANSRFEEIAVRPQPFAFDEWGGMSVLAKMYNVNQYNRGGYDDINFLKKEFVSCQKRGEKQRNSIFSFWNGQLTRISLLDGKIYEEPTCYVHFQKRKFEIGTHNTEAYLIIPNRIIDWEEPTVSKLKSWGRNRLIYPHAIKMRYNNLLRKLNIK